MSKLFSNQKGVSLVEVMVAAGISSVIALGTMKINENSQRGMRKVATDFEINNLMNLELRSTLGDANACTDAFNGANLTTPSNPDDINSYDRDNFSEVRVFQFDESGNPKPGSDKVLLSTNPSSPKSKIAGEWEVSGISLARSSQNSCLLEIRLSRVDVTDGANKFGTRDLVKRLPMGCGFNNSNDLVSCSATGGGDGQWEPRTSGTGDQWLENSYGIGSISLGANGTSTAPYSRIYVKPAASGDNVWAQDGSTNLLDGIGLDDNFVIRWGGGNASGAQQQGVGVGVHGDGTNCVNFQRSADTTPFLASCNSGTTIGGGATINGDTSITGDTSVAGSLSVTNGLTVSGGGATITGSTQTSNWFNSINNTGWRNTTHGGGWYMKDSTWLRVYGGKDIYAGTGIIRTDGSLQVGGSGSKFHAKSDGSVDIAGALAVTGHTTFSSATGSGLLKVTDNNIRVTGTKSAGTGGVTVDTAIHSYGKGVFDSMYVAGDSWGASWNVHSDRRFKEDIKPLRDPLQNILSLEPVEYVWRDVYAERFNDQERQLGLIAQDVQKIYPELVKEKNGFLSVNYTALIAPIIDSIKELYNSITDNSEEIEENKREIASLKKENAELKARLDRIEKALAEQKK